MNTLIEVTNLILERELRLLKFAYKLNPLFLLSAWDGNDLKRYSDIRKAEEDNLETDTLLREMSQKDYVDYCIDNAIPF